MATKEKKAKAGKSEGKKSAKKSDDQNLGSSEFENVIKDVKDGIETTPYPKSETTEVENAPPQEPTPEPTYNEPKLNELIVERYEGEYSKGNFHGEGEAWFVGSHHYQGEFSEGMMHGKGTYTWSDKVEYSGDFCNNHVTGNGVYRWPDGSSYEGEVVDGLRHGYGTFSVADNLLSYTGEWQLGKRTGKGRMNYDPEKRAYYDGFWVNNIRHGYGVRQYPSGNIYEGTWFKNKRHGEGTMKWLDRDQIYSGQWQDGDQHGIGQHIWFLRRVGSSQYPMRNTYEGKFVKGVRTGHGTFCYANGSKYVGEWNNNQKHGKGKFVFKNGRVYEGVFDCDHIREYPAFVMEGNASPDLQNIRTRTPLPMENMSIHSNSSRNTIGPSLQMDIGDVLEEFSVSERDTEMMQAYHVIVRHVSALKRVYEFYSCLGYNESPDNTYIMTRLQFWRLMKDARFHHADVTLAQLDNVLSKYMKGKEGKDPHDPYQSVLFREFLNQLIVISYEVYSGEYDGQPGTSLAWCFTKLMELHVLKYACKVKGFFYYETRRAINALVHTDRTYNIYQSACLRAENETTKLMKMRDFLLLLKDLSLLNDDLDAKAVVEVLAADDPNVRDEFDNYCLEFRMTFLEFFEALIGCATRYMTERAVSLASEPSIHLPSSEGMTGEQPITGEIENSVISLLHAQSARSKLMDGEKDEGEPSVESPRGTTPGTSGSGPGAGLEAETATQGDPEENKELGAADADDGQDKGTVKTGPMSETMSVGSGDGDVLMKSATSGAKKNLEDGDDLSVRDEEAEMEEEINIETRKFNFWTHQVHLFFHEKFFPAMEHLMLLEKRVKEVET